MAERGKHINAIRNSMILIMQENMALVRVATECVIQYVWSWNNLTSL